MQFQIISHDCGKVRSHCSHSFCRPLHLCRRCLHFIRLFSGRRDEGIKNNFREDTWVWLRFRIYVSPVCAAVDQAVFFQSLSWILGCFFPDLFCFFCHMLFSLCHGGQTGISGKRYCTGGALAEIIPVMHVSSAHCSLHNESASCGRLM